MGAFDSTATPSRLIEPTAMMKTAFASDPRFQNHATGQGHPERSSRLAHTLDHLETKEWFASLQTVEAVRCETEWLARVHHRQLIERARASCEQGLSYLDTPDVAISAESFEVARLAAGTVLKLADEVAHGRVDNGFALVRPPGHHAEHNAALGFCLFNNIAIAARYLQDQHGLEKILIVDWDVHHGNGTQHLFEEDPSVFYVSTHQYPHYPGTGAYSETGTGAGKGATLNCPMNAGAGNETYTQAFTETILPAIDAFGPDMILISAGFDAHQADPLGSINLTTEHYAWMTRRLMECADHHCNGRILSVLEGGYDLDALALSVAVHIGTLKGFSSVEKS